MIRWKHGKNLIALLVCLLLASCTQSLRPTESPDVVSPTPMGTEDASTAAPPSNPELGELLPTFTAEDILPFTEIPTHWENEERANKGYPLILQMDTAGDLYYYQSFPQDRNAEPWVLDHSVLRKCDPNFNQLWEVTCPGSVNFCIADDGIWVLLRDQNEIVCYGEDGQEKKRLSIPPPEGETYTEIIKTQKYICLLEYEFQESTEKDICSYVIIDPETGELRRFSTDDLPKEANTGLGGFSLLNYQDDDFCLLSMSITQSAATLTTKYESRIDVIDAKTGERIDTQYLGGQNPGNAPADEAVYDAEKELFYYYGRDGGPDGLGRTYKLYAQRKGEEAVLIADMPSIIFLGAVRLQINGDRLLQWCPYSRNLFSIDKNLRGTVGAQRPNTLTVQSADQSVIEQFRNQNPQWDVKGAGQTTGEDNTALLLRQDNTIDVYYMNDLDVDIDALVKNGYYVDLSKSKVIKDKINAMYPVLRDAAADGNRLWGYPVNYGYDMLYVNTGYTGTVPGIWTQLKELLDQDPKLLSTTMGYAQRLMVLQADAAGTGMNAAQRKALWQTTLDNVTAFNTILPKTGSADFEVSATMALAYAARVDPSANVVPEQFKPLPSLDAATVGKTLIQDNGYLVVNPYSKNIDAAIAYIEAYASSARPGVTICMICVDEAMCGLEDLTPKLKKANIL